MTSKAPYRYDKIVENNSSSEEVAVEAPTSAKKRPLLYILLGLMVVASWILVGVSMAVLVRQYKSCNASNEGAFQPTDRLDHFMPTRPRLHCGNSSGEAEALGCVYDPMMACWQPKECARDGTDEFVNYYPGKPWKYYFDKERTKLIPDTYALAHLGDKHYWSSSEEHLVHCAFNLMRIHNVLARGDRLDSLSSNLEHANHCANYLLEFVGTSQERIEEIHTKGTVCFLSC